MSSGEFGWETLLYTNVPSGCSLKGALFTTYDRPDERLIVEHVLPLLLKLSCEPDGEGVERQYFLLQLDRRLKQLHDQLVMISSTAREEPTDSEESESGTYGWIWRSIRHLTVGRRGKAVQHAKFWLLHWGADNDKDKNSIEYLELVVSSANLTRAAFKGQLQAAWRGCIELRPQRSEARLARWGVLPAFLRELAMSAGDGARLAPFVELLARAECPEGVTFLASVPGTHSRQVLRRTPWGAAGLREIASSGRGRVSVSILSPFIGSWSSDALRRWCLTFEGSPDRLELIWIDKNHPWARAARWLLPKVTLKTLTKAGANVLCLRHDPDDYEATDLFHDEHRPQDHRWSHAKLYLFKRGTSRRLLVTSANFSSAAWGSENRDGQLTIENFELGVCVEHTAWPFDELEEFRDEKDVATVSDLPSRESTLIMWAQAAWDGKKIIIDCRCETNRQLTGQLRVGDQWIRITHWMVGTEGHLRSGRVPWADSKRTPSLVQLTCEDETVNVAVFDERPSREREDTVPSEVDENVVQRMRDELLFEQYGGRVADEEFTNDSQETDDSHSEDADTLDASTAADSGEEIEEGEAERSDSYAVPAFALARLHLRVVDNWADQVERAVTRGTGNFELQVLQRDGELLIEAFRRQAMRDDKKGSANAIGANLAAEELSLRLKHLPEA